MDAHELTACNVYYLRKRLQDVSFARSNSKTYGIVVMRWLHAFVYIYTMLQSYLCKLMTLSIKIIAPIGWLSIIIRNGGVFLCCATSSSPTPQCFIKILCELQKTQVDINRQKNAPF